MKRLSTGLLASIFLLILIAAACQHDPWIPGGVDPVNPVDTTGNPVDTMLTGGHPCDPDSVYFALDILPILQSNCAFSDCHDQASHQEGVILTDYAHVMQTGDVRPGDPSHSDIYKVLIDNDPEDRMPPAPNAPLSQEQIALIALWINQGAQDLTCDPGAGGCNTEQVTFSGVVRPILQNTCVGCHSGSAPSGGINLSTHAGVAAVAQNGRLLGSIRREVGYSPMPQGGAPLSDCYIQQIAAWVDAGAPNN